MQMRKQLAETPQAEGRSALLGTAGASTSDRADQRSGPAQETEETVGLKAAELLQLQDRYDLGGSTSHVILEHSAISGPRCASA